MAFKLRSGNKTSFKMMGSSPVKNNGETYKVAVKSEGETYSERIAKENKRLKEVYDKQMKSYSDSTASYENRIKAFDLLKGKTFTKGQFEKVYEQVKKLNVENLKRGIYDDFQTAVIEKPMNPPSIKVNQDPKYALFKDTLTKEDIAKQLKPKNKPVKPKYHKTFTEITPLKPITPSLIKPKTPVMPPKAEVPPEVLKEWQPVKNMDLWRQTTRNPENQKKGGNKRRYHKLRKPKGKKTRNLVTGGFNRTFRSTGTSRRKNRFMAKVTFWNRKD